VKFGKLDIVFANAGIQRRTRRRHLAGGCLKSVLKTNVTAVCSSRCRRRLRISTTGGSIIAQRIGDLGAG